MYQSIHTTVIGPGRTTSGDSNPHVRNAPSCRIRGCSSLAYKEGNKEKVTNDPLQKQLDWFKDLIELQNETKDLQRFR